MKKKRKKKTPYQPEALTAALKCTKQYSRSRQKMN